MDQVYFDSRYNYQKILTDDSVDITTNNFPETATIDHDLGKRPRVKVWVETASGLLIPAMKGNGVTSALITEVYSDLDSDINQVSYSVSTTQLKINLYSFNTITRTIYYRIYADGS